MTMQCQLGVFYWQEIPVQIELASLCTWLERLKYDPLYVVFGTRFSNDRFKIIMFKIIKRNSLGDPAINYINVQCGNMPRVFTGLLRYKDTVDVSRTSSCNVEELRGGGWPKI